MLETIAHARQAWVVSPLLKETVGDRVRRARKLEGFSNQDLLAEAAEVPRGYIADLESNAVTAPRDPERLKRVARACKVSFRWLREGTGWHDEEEELPPWDSALVAKLVHEGTTEDEAVDTVQAVRLLLSRRSA